MTYMNNAVRWVVFSARPCRSVRICMYALRKHQHQYVLCILFHAAHGTCTVTEMSITEYLLVQGAASFRGIGELDVSNAYRMFMRSRNTGNTGFDKVTRCFGCWHTAFRRYVYPGSVVIDKV